MRPKQLGDNLEAFGSTEALAWDADGLRQVRHGTGQLAAGQLLVEADSPCAWLGPARLRTEPACRAEFEAWLIGTRPLP